MLAKLCNLVAAILCTIGTAVCTIALSMSEPTTVNLIAEWGTGIGVVGSIAWIIAAVIGVRQP